MILIKRHMGLSLTKRQRHLNLRTSCIERGGNHNNFRGVLAEYLGTQFPSGMGVMCCHACNNEKCSNPKHLYWGTARENVMDAVSSGRWIQGGNRGAMKALRAINRQRRKSRGLGQ